MSECSVVRAQYGFRVDVAFEGNFGMTGAVFIAGTDTGIGKTHVACTLLHALRADGLRVCGMKPVASGCDQTAQGPRNGDALSLQAASSAPAPAYASINPMALHEPVSPHLAAAREGMTIAMPPLQAAFQELRASHEVVVVEGVGGWRVPLAPDMFASDIPKAWALPVVLVVGLRLGCLNHALLSAQAIVADGCQLLGWVGNGIDPAMTAVEENIATLRELLPAPCLGILPHGLRPERAVSFLEPFALAVLRKL